MTYGVWIGDITKIESVEQTFSLNFMVMMRWHDPRLRHDGPDVKQFDLGDIWHPRLLLTNDDGDSTASLPEKVDVTPDGTVLFRQRYIGAFTQPLNLRAFPFDTETFRVRSVMLGSSPQDLALAPDAQTAALGWREGIGINQRLTVQDWSVLSVATQAEPFHVSPGVELASFTFEFTARRNSQHFVIKVSVDTLAPNNRFVKAINQTPVTRGIPHHVISGDCGKGGNKDKTPPVMSDGIVPYWSSHMDTAVSELVVPSHHSAHQNPQAIAEVKRILKSHATR